MRPDTVPGAIFPDYELSDHTAKRRKLSDCKGDIQWFSSSAADVSVPRNHRQPKLLVELHRELEVGYCRLEQAGRLGS